MSSNKPNSKYKTTKSCSISNQYKKLALPLNAQRVKISTRPKAGHRSSAGAYTRGLADDSARNSRTQVHAKLAELVASTKSLAKAQALKSTGHSRRIVTLLSKLSPDCKQPHLRSISELELAARCNSEKRKEVGESELSRGKERGVVGVRIKRRTAAMNKRKFSQAPVVGEPRILSSNQAIPRVISRAEHDIYKTEQYVHRPLIVLKKENKLKKIRSSLVQWIMNCILLGKE